MWKKFTANDNMLDVSWMGSHHQRARKIMNSSSERMELVMLQQVVLVHEENNLWLSACVNSMTLNYLSLCEDGVSL